MTTWNEALHPRQGGKFAPKGTATQSGAKPAAGKGGGSGKGGGGAEGLSYNGRTGAGYGKKGGDKRVSVLQKQLNRLGLTDSKGKALVVDGKLGPRTTAAIKKAQRALGMKADGVATPGLLARLRDLKDIKSAKQTGAKKDTMPVKGKGPRKTTPTRQVPLGRVTPTRQNAPGPTGAGPRTPTPAKRTPPATKRTPRKSGPTTRQTR